MRESATAIEVALDIAPGNQAAIPDKAAEIAPEVRGVCDGSEEPPHHAIVPTNGPGGSFGGWIRWVLLLFAFICGEAE